MGKLGDATAARAAYAEALNHAACPEPMRERLAGLAGLAGRAFSGSTPGGPRGSGPAR